MPFDGPIPTTKPDLRILSDVLRGGPEHPMWPSGHQWCFASCKMCAMGIASKIWPEEFPTEFDFVRAILPEMGYDNLCATFGDKLARQLGKSAAAVIPADVADAIDEYLAGAGR